MIRIADDFVSIRAAMLRIENERNAGVPIPAGVPAAPPNPFRITEGVPAAPPRFGKYYCEINCDEPDPATEAKKAKGAKCKHDWKVWPETNGQEQRCMHCGIYRATPAHEAADNYLIVKAMGESKPRKGRSMSSAELLAEYVREREWKAAAPGDCSCAQCRRARREQLEDDWKPGHWK